MFKVKKVGSPLLRWAGFLLTALLPVDALRDRIAPQHLIQQFVQSYRLAILRVPQIQTVVSESVEVGCSVDVLEEQRARNH